MRAMLLVPVLLLAACGQDRRQAADDLAAKEAALAAGVAAWETRAAAAAVPAGPPPGMRPTPMTLTRLSCADGSTPTLRYFPEQGVAVLVTGDGTRELQMEPVAAGVRYAAPELVVTGEGTSYMISRAGAEPLACTAEG